MGRQSRMVARLGSAQWEALDRPDCGLECTKDPRTRLGVLANIGWIRSGTASDAPNPKQQINKHNNSASLRRARAGQPLMVLRLTFVGELGFELHVPSQGAVEVYGEVMRAGGARCRRRGLLRRAPYRGVGTPVPKPTAFR